MQLISYFHCFSYHGLHVTCDTRSPVLDLQIPNAAYGIEYSKDRPYRSLLKALQEPTRLRSTLYIR